MRHLLVFSLLAVGCASAPPPEPRVVERVIYVNSPSPAPVVEHQGYRAERNTAHRKAPSVWFPSRAMKRHSKHDRAEKPDPHDEHEKADKPEKREKREKHAKREKNEREKREKHAKREKNEREKREKHSKRCDDKQTPEARERCGRDVARR